MKNLELNDTVKFWLDNIPKRYIAETEIKNIKIRFDGGESFIPKIKKLQPVLNTLKLADLVSYSSPDFLHLKRAIARHDEVNIENISIGSGCDNLIENLPRILLNPEDSVIVPVPTFFRFIESSLRRETKVIQIQLNEQDDFRITEEIADEIILNTNRQNAKLIWLANPNNPTGQPLDFHLIKKIIENVNSFVILDETLHDFLDPKNFPSISSLVNTHKNLIVIKSLSKIFGLAGIRVGWAIGNPVLIQIIEKWRLPYEIATTSAKIAIQVLEQNNIELVRKKIKKEREFIEKELEALPGIKVCKGSLTNLILFKHNKKDLFKELLEHAILTADFRGSNGLNGEKFIRISVQNRNKNRQMIEALKEIC